MIPEPDLWVLLHYPNLAYLINGFFFFLPQTHPIGTHEYCPATSGPNLKPWPNPTQSLKKKKINFTSRNHNHNHKNRITNHKPKHKHKHKLACFFGSSLLIKIFHSLKHTHTHTQITNPNINRNTN